MGQHKGARGRKSNYETSTGFGSAWVSIRKSAPGPPWFPCRGQNQLVWISHSLGFQCAVAGSALLKTRTKRGGDYNPGLNATHPPTIYQNLGGGGGGGGGGASSGGGGGYWREGGGGGGVGSTAWVGRGPQGGGGAAGSKMSEKKPPFGGEKS